MNTPAHHYLLMTSYAKIHQHVDLPVYMNNFTDIDCMNDFPHLQENFISRQKVIEVVA